MNTTTTLQLYTNKKNKMKREKPRSFDFALSDTTSQVRSRDGKHSAVVSVVRAVFRPVGY